MDFSKVLLRDLLLRWKSQLLEPPPEFPWLYKSLEGLGLIRSRGSFCWYAHVWALDVLRSHAHVGERNENNVWKPVIKIFALVIWSILIVTVWEKQDDALTVLVHCRETDAQVKSPSLVKGRKGLLADAMSLCWESKLLCKIVSHEGDLMGKEE